jgi:hypothetical protein
MSSVIWVSLAVLWTMLDDEAVLVEGLLVSSDPVAESM